jgi:uncharacterized protein involved in outer membrane biogenesis
MRRVLIALAVLAILAMGALWAVPRYLDWTAYRADLAWLATQRLGRAVYLTGPVRLTLLPQPVIEAEGVSVAGPEAEGDPVLGARALRLRLGWAALLRGQFEPREVALVGADLRLPWPPPSAFRLRPPGWLTTFQAKVENSRVSMGRVVLENVSATISSSGPAEALTAEGRFTWRGSRLDFRGTLGRPGWDAVAPLELALRGSGADFFARGALLPEGGFEGTTDFRGSDLSALMPAPALPFRAQGRLSVSADLITADELALDLAGNTARGAATLRLAPAARVDVALTAARLDLDPWIAALRGPATRPLPVGIDLSAETASFRGIALRRLRGGALLDGDRVTLTDIAALLPGDTEVTLSGASAGNRLELQLRAAGGDLRATLAALGQPLAGVDPTRLRQADIRTRLVLEESQASLADMTATIDGTRLSGAGVLRFGARPQLGLGLSLDRLDLARFWPAGTSWASASPVLAGFDANLRLSAESLAWDRVALQGASIDAALENGRLTLRRLAGTLAAPSGGAPLAAAGVVQLGVAPRFTDLSLELTAPRAAPLLAVLPGDWPDGTPLATQPLAFRLAGGGPLEALQLRATAELGELRAEAQGTVDANARRAAGTVTLRHPGAPRLLAESFGAGAGDWLGQGSLALIATLNVTPQAVSAENLDLVAAALRANGSLALALDGPRPRLTGRVTAERLPLPGWSWRAADPLPLAALQGLDAELALTATRIEPADSPALDQATAALRLAAGTLTLADLRAQLGGGTLTGGFALATAGVVPRLTLNAQLSDATLGGPLLEMPVDIGAGRISGEITAQASGHGPGGLLATLSGEARLAVRDGALIGFDLPAAARAARLEPLGAAEAAMRAALLAGSTPFEQLNLAARLEAGRAVLGETSLVAAGGITATGAGEVDLSRQALDLRLAAQLGEGPEIALRLNGPAGRPRAVPELAPWLRWRSAQ